MLVIDCKFSKKQLDIMKSALVLLYDELKGTDAKIIGCIHDEIILESPEDTTDKVAHILEEKMILAGQIYLKKVPVEVDVCISDSWA